MKGRLHGNLGPLSAASMRAAEAAGIDLSGVTGETGQRRKSVMRRTVDYNTSFLSALERRVWQRDYRDRRALQPDVTSYPDMVPPPVTPDQSANAITTKFVKTATNKMRCPVFTLAWTPEGRRLITGASSGEFTLWNGLTFNFETILQAHDAPVRTMKWAHDGTWMVTGDHGGYIKYWQLNMNNVKMFQAHKEPVRDVSFSPTDAKFASCSDDGTVRIWDFYSCNEEQILPGHGADVKCVDWHPIKGIVASGSKDTQQPVKLWDPKSRACLTTLHAHKNTVMDVRWNKNGNWLLTASRDHLLKIFDVRNLKEELQTFRGHKREALTLAWHPVHEELFASGGSDGAIMFWSVGCEKEVGAIENAHESSVWSLDWHPVGHILCSGSNDHTCKFWTRNRPGDTMRDKYNLNTMPYGQGTGVDDGDAPAMNHHHAHHHGHNSSAASTVSSVASSATAAVIPGIPGMASDDRIYSEVPPPAMGKPKRPVLPGFADQSSNNEADSNKPKKVPFAKPIPKNFVNSWNHDTSMPPPNMGGPPPGMGPGGPMGGPPPDGFPSLQPPPPQAVAEMDDPNCISLQELQRQATAVVAFGGVYPVLPGSNLFMAILSGEMAVKDVLRSEFLS